MSRETNKTAGSELRRAMGQDDEDPGLKAPGYTAYIDEYYYHSIGNRRILNASDRVIPVLTALCFRGSETATERMVKFALDSGLRPQAVPEIFIQAALYGGLPKTEEAISSANRVFAERGISLPEHPEDKRSIEQMDADGTKIMEKLHGQQQGSGYASPKNPITFSLYSGAIRHGYGQLWMRPGLDLRQRVIVAIAGFTSASLYDSLRRFAISALNVGLSKDEVAEAAIQTAPWNGVPIALNGLKVISDAFDDAGV